MESRNVFHGINIPNIFRLLLIETIVYFSMHALVDLDSVLEKIEKKNTSISECIEYPLAAVLENAQ